VKNQTKGAGTSGTCDSLLVHDEVFNMVTPLPPTNLKTERNQSLDILRGIAILLVVGGHYGYPAILYRIGWSGVDLFFVLSGFLISGLLFKEYSRSGSINLKLFWIRRGYKIYPAFYAFMVFIIVTYAALGRLNEQIFSDLFFMQDYIRPIAEHCWSLGVEEKFYFLLPVLLVILIHLRRKANDPFKSIPYLFVAIFAGCLALRIAGLLTGQFWFDVRRQAHLRMDVLFAGVTLGYYKEFHSDWFKRAGTFPLWIFALALLLPIVLFHIYSPVMVTLGLSATLVGFSALLLWFVNHSCPNWLPLRWLAWIGQCSYSIYLWNIVVKSKLGYHEANWGIASLPLYIAASLGVGWLMVYLVETPFLALREKHFPAKRVAAGVKGCAAAVSPT
jgi:peptidoglycan/LPS O-acetylase OafA/YrhL